jgi:hypothetical protein
MVVAPVKSSKGPIPTPRPNNTSGSVTNSPGSALQREHHVLIERRLKDDPTTLEELSRHYGISRERVRQVEVRAFEKLQMPVKARLVSAKVSLHSLIILMLIGSEALQSCPFPSPCVSLLWSGTAGSTTIPPIADYAERCRPRPQEPGLSEPDGPLIT